MREALKETQINNANSDKVVRDLLLDAAEVDLALQIAIQEFNARAVTFMTQAAEVRDVSVEARRARAYIEQDPANDPSFRLVRDSIRLLLADQLRPRSAHELSGRQASEYEYAARLSVSNFRISDIYKARTADDIIRFLDQLGRQDRQLPGRNSPIDKADFTISVAQHLLGLTDENLGLTGDAAKQERTRRFRVWVAQNTRLEPDATGRPVAVLNFNFTTSAVTNSVFSNVILTGYDYYWLHKMAGIGLPFLENTGFGMNLLWEQPIPPTPSNFRYRTGCCRAGWRDPSSSAEWLHFRIPAC